jgi:hypothetical protein
MVGGDRPDAPNEINAKVKLWEPWLVSALKKKFLRRGKCSRDKFKEENAKNFLPNKTSAERGSAQLPPRNIRGGG